MDISYFFPVFIPSSFLLLSFPLYPPLYILVCLAPSSSMTSSNYRFSRFMISYTSRSFSVILPISFFQSHSFSLILTVSFLLSHSSSLIPFLSFFLSISSYLILTVSFFQFHSFSLILLVSFLLSHSFYLSRPLSLFDEIVLSISLLLFVSRPFLVEFPLYLNPYLIFIPSLHFSLFFSV